MNALEKIEALANAESETAEVTTKAKKSWESLDGKSSSQDCSGRYLPDVEGKVVPLSPIAEVLHVSPELEIKLHSNIQYEPCVQAQSGAWVSLGQGTNQAYAATHIFVRCTTKEAANERLARVALLVALDKYLLEHPEGGYWEFRGAHFKIQRVKSNQPEVEIEADEAF